MKTIKIIILIVILVISAINIKSYKKEIVKIDNENIILKDEITIIEQVDIKLAEEMFTEETKENKEELYEEEIKTTKQLKVSTNKMENSDNIDQINNLGKNENIIKEETPIIKPMNLNNIYENQEKEEYRENESLLKKRIKEIKSKINLEE